jgi:hypothetical protein
MMLGYCIIFNLGLGAIRAFNKDEANPISIVALY